MDFKAFTDDIEKKKWCVYGVEVYEDGTLTHSWGDTDNNLHDIYSATKTVESISAGLAYDRGLIDFSRSILDYLPEDKVEEYSDVRQIELTTDNTDKTVSFYKSLGFTEFSEIGCCGFMRG